MPREDGRRPGEGPGLRSQVRAEVVLRRAAAGVRGKRQQAVRLVPEAGPSWEPRTGTFITACGEAAR